jgi:hypothetical protein
VVLVLPTRWPKPLLAAVTQALLSLLLLFAIAQVLLSLLSAAGFLRLFAHPTVTRAQRTRAT